MTGMKRARLSAIALGVAFGVMCGGWMLIVGILATNYDMASAKEMMMRWKEMFPGADMTMLGSFVAGAWGFLKGFVSGVVLGFIYNLCLCCCTRCCPCCKCSCSKEACGNCNPEAPKV